MGLPPYLSHLTEDEVAEALRVYEAEKPKFLAMYERVRRDMLSYGDCVSCDNYVLNESEKPHCPTCARLLREGKAL